MQEAWERRKKTWVPESLRGKVVHKKLMSDCRSTVKDKFDTLYVFSWGGGSDKGYWGGGGRKREKSRPNKHGATSHKSDLGSSRRGIQQSIRSREQKSGRQSILKIRILELSTYRHCLKLKNQATLSTQLCLTAKTRTVAPGALPFPFIVKTKRTSPPWGQQHNIPPKDMQVLIPRIRL